MSISAQQCHQDKPMLLVGRIGAPWGVKGHTRIVSFTDPISDIFEYKNWYLLRQGQWQQVQHNDVRSASPKNLTVRIDGIDTRTQAESFVHADIYILKEDLPECEQGTFYWDDLIGLEVVNTQAQVLGVLEHLYETGAHDNMVVSKNDKTLHVPFVMDTFVVSVDLNSKRIVVDWPEVI